MDNLDEIMDMDKGNLIAATPLITVLTTVYNGRRFLPFAVESILNQTYRDFEYIVVDDGSTDDTLKYLNSVSDPRLKVISLPRSGRGVCLNKGAEMARGKYLAILDADDIALKSRLEIQLHVMEKRGTPQSIAVLGGGFTLSEKDLCKETPSLGLPAGISFSEIDPREFLKRNALCHSSTFIRMSALKEVGFYDGSRTELFDYDLWVRLAQKGHRFRRINFPIVYKRIHTQQNFEQKKRIKYLWSAAKCKLRLMKEFSPKPKDYLYLIATFLYGCTPTFFRKALMEKWK